MNILIVGGGRVGAHLARLLMTDGHQVKVVEIHSGELHQLRRDLPPGAIILGNGTDPGVLESAGIRNMQVVAAVTGADATNLVITSLARFEFGVPRTIARVNDPRYAWMFTPDMGVDTLLNQADVIAHLIAAVVE